MKNFFAHWWKNHKTKTLGALQVMGGAIILYKDQVEQVLTRKHYGTIILAAGVGTAVLGFLNGKKDVPPQS